MTLLGLLLAGAIGFWLLRVSIEIAHLVADEMGENAAWYLTMSLILTVLACLLVLWTM